MQQLCDVVATTACDYEQRCGLIDGNTRCSGVVPQQVFDCGGQLAYDVDAGNLVVDSVAAARCLALVSDGGCSSADQAAIEAACNKELILVGNVPPGGTCVLDQECALADAGAGTSGVATYCILTGNTDATCVGTCSTAAALGERCDTVGYTCAQGYCFAPPDGGGGADYCSVAQAGDDCSANEPYYFCTETNSATYCDGTSCQNRGGDGTVCDLEQCGNFYECACASGTTCVAAPDAGGVCTTNVVPGQPCGPGAVCAQGCVAVPVEDGGTASLCEGVSEAGDPCGVHSSLYCDDGLTCSDPDGGTCESAHTVGESCRVDDEPFCQYGLACVSTDGGATGVCVHGASPGTACVDGNCEAYATCATTSDGGGNVCVADIGIGDACDPTIYRSCGNGAYCAPTDGGGLCAPQLPLGAPCDPNTYAACGNENQYEGYCEQTDDAGYVCLNEYCTD